MKTVTPFYDSYGNALLPGDKIIIEHDCNYQLRNGQKAVLIWNEKLGMYRFTYTIEYNGKKFSSEDDFYGIMKFRKGWEYGQ
jgi:hypothetical protein